MKRYIVERRIDEGIRTFMGGICGTIRTINAGGDKRVIIDNNKTDEVNIDDYGIRRLTPRECWRLMDFSDSDFDKAKEVGMSDSQLYKQAGNSICVGVLYHIYKELYKAMPYLFDDLKVGSFFSGIGAFEKGLDRLYDNINNVSV